ncbi:hypothetical protein [Parafrankia sp. CH37]|uniref:hypothetical protein n=1 Tax=Parafrankia sp. CH37 TaxID=683308 RepID=UPI0010421A5C|nr:hypothetical protein [Parafrankia sp. CH37]
MSMTDVDGDERVLFVGVLLVNPSVAEHDPVSLLDHHSPRRGDQTEDHNHSRAPWRRWLRRRKTVPLPF